MKFVLPPLKILGCWFLKNYNKIGAVSQCFYGVAGLLCMMWIFDTKYGVFAGVFGVILGVFLWFYVKTLLSPLKKCDFL